MKQDTTFSGMPVSKTQGVSHEYDLYVSPDTGTQTHMHWYYFQMISLNLRPGQRVRLNIRNMMRNKSMYSDGMLPKIKYEDTISNKAFGGWHIDPLVTTDVKFFQTDLKNNFDETFIK